MDGRVTNSRRCLEYLGRGVDASASVHIAPTCCGCPNCPHAVSAECVSSSAPKPSPAEHPPLARVSRLRQG